jgi:hypothetical protein
MNRVERVEAADQGFRVVHGTPVPAGIERANTFLGLDRDAFEGAMTEDVEDNGFLAVPADEAFQRNAKPPGYEMRVV